LILIAVFALVMLPAAFAQGTPSQSQDPSTQTPSTQPPSQSPSTSPSQSPSTQNPSSATSSSSSSDAHSFVGSIVKNNGKFMLHTGGTDYELDDQSQAAKFEGKDVKVTGSVDQPTNTIRVQSIAPASSM
jgi:uncharacterized protein YdeI (BOF family)